MFSRFCQILPDVATDGLISVVNIVDIVNTVIIVKIVNIVKIASTRASVVPIFQIS